MKIFAPKYCERFTCTADKCKHSCCIGWEIDIDEETHSAYKMLDHEYGEAIRKSIDEQDVPHFALADEKRCPHLDECGLCNIIKNVGEDYLCDICREHPRFYNDTKYGMEMGIGLSCEEACRIILDSDDYDVFYEAGEAFGEPLVTEYDAIKLRSNIYRLMKDDTIISDQKVTEIADYYDCLMFEVEKDKLFSSMEYLDESHRELFLKFDEMAEISHSDKKFERIFCYFVYRYCSSATRYYDFTLGVQLAYFLLTLIVSISNEENIAEMARIVSEEIEYSDVNIQILKDYFKFEERIETVKTDEDLWVIE